MSPPQGHGACTCRLSATSGGGPHEPGCGALLVSSSNAWCVVCGYEIKAPHTECWRPATIAAAVVGAQLAAEVERAAQPVAHEASPVEDETRRAMIASPELLEEFARYGLVHVDERKVAEAYRGRVLEALQRWGERPSDLRSVEQVILDVELP